jgi:hypothetical protein
MHTAIKIQILFTGLLLICSCSTTQSTKNSDKSEAIFMLNNYGRLYEPKCINYFNVLNIDKITAGGRYKKSKRGLITIQLKDSVQLLSFSEFLQRNNLDKKYKNTYSVYLDSVLILKPNKLIFDASQKLNCEIICDSAKGNSQSNCLLKISRPK